MFIQRIIKNWSTQQLINQIKTIESFPVKNRKQNEYNLIKCELKSRKREVINQDSSLHDLPRCPECGHALLDHGQDECDTCNQKLKWNYASKLEDGDYLLGCCPNIDCTEFGGGWKYSLDFPEEEQKDCFCPSCGSNLEFINQSDL